MNLYLFNFLPQLYNYYIGILKPFMKKAAPYLVLILLALLVIFIKRCKGEGPYPKNANREVKAAGKRNRGFDRTLSYIEYTAHAKCRMKCRHISQEDIEDIMRSGEINYSKSEVNESPCPVYAVRDILMTGSTCG